MIQAEMENLLKEIQDLSIEKQRAAIWFTRNFGLLEKLLRGEKIENLSEEIERAKVKKDDYLFLLLSLKKMIKE